MITTFITSQCFSSVASIIGLIADIAILILTAYTLYITAISRKLELVSPSFSFSTFYGESMALNLMNKSLHAIPIQEVYILKKNNDGQFVSIKLAEFKDPVAIDSWSVKRIKMEPFTKIDGYKSDDLITDAVIYAKSGNKLIWIKPYKKAPIREAKKVYKNHQFQEIHVYRKKCDGVIISEAVDVRIHIRMKDMNGQYVLRKLFGITGFDEGKSVLLNEDLLGYNSFTCNGMTALDVKEAIHLNFGIRKDDIEVQMIS